MAVRVQRSSVPSLAADGSCGLLGAPFPGVGGGLVSPPPAVLGGGVLQATRRFSGVLWCCCCAELRWLVLLCFPVLSLFSLLITQCKILSVSCYVDKSYTLLLLQYRQFCTTNFHPFPLSPHETITLHGVEPLNREIRHLKDRLKITPASVHYTSSYPNLSQADAVIEHIALALRADRSS